MFFQEVVEEGEQRVIEMEQVIIQKEEEIQVLKRVLEDNVVYIKEMEGKVKEIEIEKNELSEIFGSKEEEIVKEKEKFERLRGEVKGRLKDLKDSLDESGQKYLDLELERKNLVEKYQLELQEI